MKISTNVKLMNRVLVANASILTEVIGVAVSPDSKLSETSAWVIQTQ